MKKKTVSRRDFLRLGAVGSAGIALVACGGGTEPAAPAATTAPAATAVPTEAPVATVAPAAEAVTIDVMSPVAEYEAPYREIDRSAA